MTYTLIRFHRKRAKAAFTNIFSSLSIDKFDSVLIKPNVCGFYPPDLNLLRVLIKELCSRFNEVIIGETPSTMHSPKERFESLGILDLSKEFNNVKVIDMIESGVIEIAIPKHHAIKKLPLPKCLFEADFVINLARAGRHPSTKVTIALKNLFGFVAEKRKYFKYHIRGISKVVADVAKVVHPNLNIVEANDHILVSEDPLIVDIVATKHYLHIDPLSVRHFQLVALDRGIRIRDILNNITIKEL